MQLTENIFPNSTLFFAFPSIFRHIPAWFPGAGFKRLALEARKVAYKMRDIPLAAVQKQMVWRVPMILKLIRSSIRFVERGTNVELCRVGCIGNMPVKRRV